ncbi:MAG: glycoside hydrolase [Actinomycetota bacterium]|nr:glycoside hydrolase [Actinomycetota bacterium]
MAQGSDGIYFARSPDGGGTFQEPARIVERPPAPAMGFASVFYPRILAAGDPTTIYLTYNRFFGGEAGFTEAAVFLISSRNGGETWSQPIMVNPRQQTFAMLPTSTVTADGALYVSWFDASAWFKDNVSPWVLNVGSASGAERFGPPVPVDSGAIFGCPNTFAEPCDTLYWNGIGVFAPLAAGKDAGELFIAWWDKRDGPVRVRFSASKDGGKTWSEPRVLGAQNGFEEDEQHRPALNVRQDGSVAVAYYNLGRDRLQNTYFVVSTNGGDEFSAPALLSSEPSNINVGRPGFSDAANLGDFLGAGSSGDSIYVAWTDTRRGNENTAHTDIFFAEAISATQSRAWWIVLVVVGVVIVAGLVLLARGLLSRRGQA